MAPKRPPSPGITPRGACQPRAGGPFGGVDSSPSPHAQPHELLQQRDSAAYGANRLVGSILHKSRTTPNVSARVKESYTEGTDEIRGPLLSESRVFGQAGSPGYFVPSHRVAVWEWSATICRRTFCRRVRSHDPVADLRHHARAAGAGRRQTHHDGKLQSIIRAAAQSSGFPAAVMRHRISGKLGDPSREPSGPKVSCRSPKPRRMTWA